MTEEQFVYRQPDRLPMAVRPYSDMVGAPVWLIFADATRWTLLGTNAIVSKHGENMSTLLLDEMDTIAPRGDDKPRIEWWDIRDRQGRTYPVWAPPGYQNGTLGGILFMLRRMRRKPVD